MLTFKVTLNGLQAKFCLKNQISLCIILLMLENSLLVSGVWSYRKAADAVPEGSVVPDALITQMEELLLELIMESAKMGTPQPIFFNRMDNISTL